MFFFKLFSNIYIYIFHIPHDEGIEAVKEALLTWDSNVENGRKLGDLKNDLVEFTEIVLKNNNFEFDERHFV